MIYYTKPMHEQTAFSGLSFDEADFPVSTELCDTVLSLPMHPYLTEADINSVVDQIKSAYRV